MPNQALDGTNDFISLVLGIGGIARGHGERVNMLAIRYGGRR
jgi:hypothetical protein